MNNISSTPNSWPVIGAMVHEGDFQRGEWERLITSCQLYGLRALQLGGPLLEELLADPRCIPAIRYQLEQEGIMIAGIAGYCNIITRNSQKRKANLDFLARCLEIAPLLGNPVVATETGTFLADYEWHPTPDNDTPAAWDALVSTLRILLPIAERHGSILALEGYVNNIVNTPERMETLLEQFPSPALQVVLDPFNYLFSHHLPVQESFVEQFLTCFAARFVLAHLKDVSPQGAEAGTPEFGRGVFSFQPYLTFLREQRPDLPLIFEHISWNHIPSAIQHLYQLL